MTKAELVSLLQKYQIRLTKQRGQNFLYHQQSIDKITTLFESKEKRCIIEIGPGFGHTTRILLGHALSVHAIEVDQGCFRALQSLFAKEIDDGSLKLYHHDVLKFDFNRIQILHDKVPVIIYGNLPYNIAGKIIETLRVFPFHFEKAIFLLQKEMVDRILAKPNSDNYGVLSVMTQVYYECISHFKLSKEHFFPIPKIDSTIVELIPKQNPLNKALTMDYYFERFILSAFHQRRKKLLNSLCTSPHIELRKSDVEKAFKALDISIDQRAEELSVSQFLNLAEALTFKGD